MALAQLTPGHVFSAPVKRINEGHHVARFLTSKAYRDIGLFLLQLNHSVCPRTRDSGPAITFPVTSKTSTSPSILALQNLLSSLEGLIDDAPPDPGPRRFGNASFRTWHGLMEKRINDILTAAPFGDLIAGWDSNGSDLLTELSSYVTGGFGSAQRLDYGTGHELSFLAFLGCLWKLGFFSATPSPDIDRQIVLDVFEPYLRLVRRLILTYTLEPAGSHGVWGLDDHSFIPYMFGSAQFTRPIAETDPMPLEGSVRGAPKPADVTKADVVADLRLSNMYFAAIGFISDVKKGPFWEHSPILFDISGIRDGWGKINKGMIKMYNAEVLSKFPVVQHFHFGSIFSWGEDPEAPTPTQSMHMANQPVADAAVAQAPPPTGTAAPWAQAGRMPPPGPGIPYSRIPPGPRTGSLASRQPRDGSTSESTAANITVTKAPWAKD